MHIIDLFCRINLHLFVLAEDALELVGLCHQLKLISDDFNLVLVTSVAFVERCLALKTPFLFAEQARKLSLSWCFHLKIVAAVRVGALNHACNMVAGPLPLKSDEPLIFFFRQKA